MRICFFILISAVLLFLSSNNLMAQTESELPQEPNSLTANEQQIEEVLELLKSIRAQSDKPLVLKLEDSGLERMDVQINSAIDKLKTISENSRGSGIITQFLIAIVPAIIAAFFAWYFFAQEQTAAFEQAIKDTGRWAKEQEANNKENMRLEKRHRAEMEDKWDRLQAQMENDARLNLAQIQAKALFKMQDQEKLVQTLKRSIAIYLDIVTNRLSIIEDDIVSLENFRGLDNLRQKLEKIGLKETPKSLIDNLHIYSEIPDIRSSGIMDTYMIHEICKDVLETEKYALQEEISNIEEKHQKASAKARNNKVKPKLSSFVASTHNMIRLTNGLCEETRQRL